MAIGPAVETFRIRTVDLKDIPAFHQQVKITIHSAPTDLFILFMNLQEQLVCVRMVMVAIHRIENELSLPGESVLLLLFHEGAPGC
jgi:hypothetical protein